MNEQNRSAVSFFYVGEVCAVCANVFDLLGHPPPVGFYGLHSRPVPDTLAHGRAMVTSLGAVVVRGAFVFPARVRPASGEPTPN